VKFPLRQILAESHISAVAIAVLLVWALDSGFRGAWRVLFVLGGFVVNVVALGRLPFRWRESYFSGPQFLFPMGYLFSTVLTLGAALILSRWVYGVGPLRALSKCRAQLERRKYV
jgi:predicted benzoate:H+ symporter BenE